MGQRMRAFNWANTTVGTPDTWPPALRNTVSLLLRSKFPMFLLWGEDYIQFYNDAYRPSFGTDGKHPTALGQSGRECWKEAWDVLGPLLEQVRLGGEAVWKEDQPVPIYRNGTIENTFWTFSYSPVLDDEGKVGGVLSTCVETTSKVESLEKIRESKDELAFAIEAAELGTWDLNPFTGKFTTNARLKAWFGLRPDEEIPLQLAVDIMADYDRQRVSEEIARTMNPESGGRYETTYDIIDPKSGRKRSVLAKGRAWFGPDQKAYRFNGTLQDITEQRELELARKESAEQLFASFEQSPVGIATIDRNALTFTMANRFYGELVGRKPENLVGKPLLEALPELESQGFDKLLDEVINTGIPYLSKEVSVDLLRHGQLETIYVDLVYQPQYDANGHITGVLVVATDLTQQVTSRRMIEESELRFRSLVEEAPVATCLFVGRDFVVEVANDIMLGYLGKDRSIIGLPFAQAVPEIKGQPFLGILDKVFTSGETYQDSGAAAMLEVNGVLGTYYYDFTYKPLRNMFGEVYAILDMAVDVTERVHSERKLKESEAFRRHIFYNSPIAKLVCEGPDMILRDANEAMFGIFGKDQSVLDKPILESVPELRETNLSARYRQVFETGEAVYGYAERMVFSPHGHARPGYYDIIYKALYNTDGAIYGVMCTVTDVTAEVIARQRIEAAEISLRNAIDLAELATWHIDLQTGKIDYSERLRDWIGYKEADLDLEESPRIHPEDRDRVGQAIKDAIASGGALHFDQTYRVLHRYTGQERIIHSSGRVRYSDAGEALEISGVAQDVTLQKELQTALETEVQLRTEELNASNEELVKSNEELSQYAYVASHDLQEPLRKIRIFASMLSSQDAAAVSRHHYVDKISQAAERMSLLIKDLLEFSRLSGPGKEQAAVDLNQVVEAVRNDFDLLIVEKAAQLRTAQLPVIQAVPLQMNQLFYNLIGNALKFVKPHVPPVIEISCRVATQDTVQQYIRKPQNDKTYYDISLRDNGIGLDSAYIDQIFEIFKRLNAQDVYPGSGIGLALCRRIVANHGGHLYVESQVGEGSNFHILLPE